MSAERPGVDVVVPSSRPPRDVEVTLRRMAAMRLGPEDTLTLVDNRPAGAPALDAPHAAVRVLRASDRASSYFARNRGAAVGAADWILFVDADVEPHPELLQRYFDPPPGDETAVVAGAMIDTPPAPASRWSPAVRYAFLHRSMSQDMTLGNGRWAYAQTGNCLVRRSAFEQVGGFRDDLIGGGDADLCFRLRAAGWRIESRAGATILHHGPSTVGTLLRQRARHGAGAAWLNRTYPGSFPARRWPGLAYWTVRSTIAGLRAGLGGRRDAAIVGLLEPATVWAFELGRRRPNRAPDRP